MTTAFSLGSLCLARVQKGHLPILQVRDKVSLTIVISVLGWGDGPVDKVLFFFQAQGPESDLQNPHKKEKEKRVWCGMLVILA